MNVVELEALDRAVVVALGGNPPDGYHHKFRDLPDPTAFPELARWDGDWANCPFLPSTRWEHGGPIIERERLSLFPHSDEAGTWCCVAYKPRGTEALARAYGATPLIAAMRAFVASKKVTNGA